MMRWLESSRIPPRRMLGVFSEKTSADCLANSINKDYCHAFCAAIGASAGPTLIGLPICTDICLTEACGKGIFLTPVGMQKVATKIGSCLTNCYTQADKLDDPAARIAARAACPATCNLANELAKLPPEDKQPTSTLPPNPPGTKPGGGKPTTKPTTTPPTTKPTLAQQAGIGGIGILIGLAIVAAVVLSPNPHIIDLRSKKRTR